MEALIVDLLAWLAPGPRPYEEVMEAWRTSCPRLSVWEEALDRRLIARRMGADGRPSVAVTDAGRAWLAERLAAPV
jgi:D-3-phosphoglycerate dehydrogenase